MKEREFARFLVWEHGVGDPSSGAEVEHESPRQAAFEAAAKLGVGYREALLCVYEIGSDSAPLVYRVEPRVWYVASEHPIVVHDGSTATA